MMRRNGTIVLKPVNKDSYNVFDVRGNLLLGADDNYFIYFKDVMFKDGEITGRYLGEASENLIDDYCKQVDFFDGRFYVGLETVSMARMVAVDNRNKTLIIIEG